MVVPGEACVVCDWHRMIPQGGKGGGKGTEVFGEVN